MSSGGEGAVYIPRGRGLARRPSAEAVEAADARPPTPPRVASTPLAAAAAAACSARSPGDPSTPAPPATPDLLRARERGRGGRPARGGFTPAQRAYLATTGVGAPAAPVAVVDAARSRAYVGHFTASGRLFVAAYQADRVIRVRDASCPTAASWPLLKNVACRLLRWTVTEVSVSDDDAHLAYSSISPIVHVVPLDRGGVVHSVANVTEAHEPLSLDRVAGAHPDARLAPFGVWSLKWAPGASPTTLLAGTGGGGGVGHALLADAASGRALARVPAGDDDVNAVAWLDAGGRVFACGGDDNVVRVFDSRALRRDTGPAGFTGATDADAAATVSAAPVMALEGHLAGVTFLDARLDGVHLLSNSKDQTAKLWDCRAPATPSRRRALPVPRVDFDYRWQAWPRAARGLAHPRDASMATFTGHAVLSTLIRARLSPAAAGGAHVYAGSADGVVRVWDLVSGVETRALRHHGDVVRDASWHPTEPGVMVTSSFDGSCVRWGAAGESKGGRVRTAAGADPGPAAGGGGGQGDDWMF